MKPIAEQSGKIFDLKVIGRLLGFAAPYRIYFVWLVIITLFAGALAPLRPYLIQITVDRYISTSNYQQTLNMCLLMIGLLVLQTVFQYYLTWLSGWIGQTIIRDVRIKVYKHILKLRLRFFDNNQVGRLITRNISDVEVLSDVFTEGLAAMLGDILQLIFIVALMFYTDWRLSLVSLSMLPILLVSTYFFKEGIKKTFNEVRSAVANLNTFVQEHITGMSVVQLFAAENREFDKFKIINKQHRHANIRSVLYYSIYFPVAEIISAAGIGLLVWYGAGLVMQNEITLGVLIAFIMYITMFFRPIRTIADRFNTLQMGIVSADRLGKLLDTDDFTPNTGVFVPTQPLQGHIRFDGIWFGYNPDEFVLKNLSLEAKPGQVLALVGPTGAGKSSIINLINRFYEPSKGIISLDGVPIENYPLSWLRGHIGMVLQDVFLFSGSIRDNIILGNSQITDAHIEEAARQIGAWDFISKLPNGIDYDVRERGNSLSTGQRQLISFVRVMVANPRILILDEATSSIDTETEEMIQHALELMMHGRTSIIIAHRLSTIQNADAILVIKDGQLAEQGTHHELIQQNGLYANLHKMQFKELA